MIKFKTLFRALKKVNYPLVFVFTFLFLAACGSSVQLANGIGGTGITKGRVTSFGSMFVNGVKFNTDNATFIRDGVSSKKQEDFNTGEIVSIKGTVNNGRTSGVATEVTFSNTIEGAITSAPSKNTVEILGQTININSLTVFHGFNELSNLRLGNIIEVSGFSLQENITASSIKLINNSFISGSVSQVEGLISSLNKESQNFKINNLLIDYSNAAFDGFNEDDIDDGIFVTISSDENIEDNSLKANSISSITNSLLPNTYYELEGYVTGFNSTTRFALDYENRISTNDATVFTNGSSADIELDTFLIAIGTTDANGVLISDEIFVQTSSKSLIIEATIESIDRSNNSLVILGNTIFIDNFTLISDDTSEDFAELSLSEFSLGDSVYVDASNADGSYSANRLSKISPISNSYITGTIDSIDSNQNSFSIANNNISINSTTTFVDDDGNQLNSIEFFNQIEAGITEIEVEAISLGNQELTAVTVIFINSENE